MKLIKYFKDWINYFLWWKAIRKHKKQEEACKNGLHSWLKNENWYQRDKHGNNVFHNRYEFNCFRGRFQTIYYTECEYCGYKKVTRDKINYD